MLQIRSWFMLSVLVSAVTPLLAQSRGLGGRGSNGSLLEAGTKLPEVKLYDDQGEEFSTSRLLGQYTVLVFGCLT